MDSCYVVLSEYLGFAGEGYESYNEEVYLKKSSAIDYIIERCKDYIYRKNNWYTCGRCHRNLNNSMNFVSNPSVKRNPDLLIPDKDKEKPYQYICDICNEKHDHQKDKIQEYMKEYLENLRHSIERTNVCNLFSHKGGYYFRIEERDLVDANDKQ